MRNWQAQPRRGSRIGKRENLFDCQFEVLPAMADHARGEYLHYIQVAKKEKMQKFFCELFLTTYFLTIYTCITDTEMYNVERNYNLSPCKNISPHINNHHKTDSF